MTARRKNTPIHQLFLETSGGGGGVCGTTGPHTLPRFILPKCRQISFVTVKDAAEKCESSSSSMDGRCELLLAYPFKLVHLHTLPLCNLTPQSKKIEIVEK